MTVPRSKGDATNEVSLLDASEVAVVEIPREGDHEGLL
jgi:hypothetical protein